MRYSDIAIVGGGCSGVLVAAQLFRQAFGGSVTIVEPRAALGRGLAYSTPYDEHLLNVPAGKMSALPSEPSHFLDWLRARRFPHASPEFFAPRKVYGEYLGCVLEAETSRGTGRFTHLSTEVAGIRSDESGAELMLCDHSTTRAKRVVLALGNPASSPAPAPAHPDMREHWYVSPWLGDALRLNEPGERVLLIGTGLTAVDAALAILGQDENCRIYMVSRRGVLSHVHNLALPPAGPSELGECRNLRCMLHQLRKHIWNQGQSEGWRMAIDSLRPVSNQIWQELSVEDRRRFMRHLKTYWEQHRHRMAPEVHIRMKEFERRGCVEIIAGRLRETSRHGRAIKASIVVRHVGERVVEVDRVINCTGIQENYLVHPRPLITSLIRNGQAQANDLGIGFRTDLGGAMINAMGVVSSVLFTLGPPRRGELVETTAVPEIRTQAETLAHRLLT